MECKFVLWVIRLTEQTASMSLRSKNAHHPVVFRRPRPRERRPLVNRGSDSSPEPAIFSIQCETMKIESPDLCSLIGLSLLFDDKTRCGGTHVKVERGRRREWRCGIRNRQGVGNQTIGKLIQIWSSSYRKVTCKLASPQ